MRDKLLSRQGRIGKVEFFLDTVSDSRIIKLGVKK